MFHVALVPQLLDFHELGLGIGQESRCIEITRNEPAFVDWRRWNSGSSSGLSSRSGSRHRGWRGLRLLPWARSRIGIAHHGLTTGLLHGWASSRTTETTHDKQNSEDNQTDQQEAGHHFQESTAQTHAGQQGGNTQTGGNTGDRAQEAGHARLGSSTRSGSTGSSSARFAPFAFAISAVVFAGLTVLIALSAVPIAILANAARVMDSTPGLMNLRLLQTMDQGSALPGTTRFVVHMPGATLSDADTESSSEGKR